MLSLIKELENRCLVFIVYCKCYLFADLHIYHR